VLISREKIGKIEELGNTLPVKVPEANLRNFCAIQLLGAESGKPQRCCNLLLALLTEDALG